MKVIVISTMLSEENRQMLRDTAAETGAELFFFRTEEEALKEASDAEVIYGYGIKTAKSSKALRWLCVPSAGVDYLLAPDAFANKDCLLTNSAGAFGVSISEHMIAVILMMLRRIPEFQEGASLRKWLAPRTQRSLKDSRVTALGTGDIGSCFAKRVRAFEPAALVGVNRSGVCGEPSFDRILRVSDLDVILPETDILAMSLPATPETEGILSGERIARLPKGSYIVNVGRGSAIDEEALAEALHSGHLAGAALDVFQKEPLPKDSPLWTAPHLVITPHVAGNLTIPYTKNRNVEMFCEDLRNYANGRKLRYLVDRTRGY